MAKSKTVKAPAEEAKIKTKIPVVKSNLRDGGETPSFDGIARPFTLFFGEATFKCTECNVTEEEDMETGDKYLSVEMIMSMSGPGYYDSGTADVGFRLDFSGE